MERKYTRKERLANWFYYNKWWLVVGAVLLWIVGSMIWNALGIGQVEPDYRVAYMGTRRLPEECVQALEAGLAALAEDHNGDGTVTVAVTQYVTANSVDPENAAYAYAAEMSMLADITEGYSFFFLLEDPEYFQQSFQILAHTDGSMPDETDYEAADKVYRWADCPVLSAMELCTYTDRYPDITESGNVQDLLSELSVGIRYFYDPEDASAQEYNLPLWNAMTAGAILQGGFVNNGYVFPR